MKTSVPVRIGPMVIRDLSMPNMGTNGAALNQAHEVALTTFNPVLLNYA